MLGVLQQLERAEQTGNGQAWIDLWSPKSRVAGRAETKDMIRPNPTTRYRASKVFVQGDMAALIATMSDQFISMRFARENGAWKILDQTWNNVAIDPASLYALVPPPDGAFARAGSPWESVTPASGTGKWKLRAAYDESFIYVRIEGAKPFPPVNTEVKGTFPNLASGVERGWPVMKIRIAGPPPREYTFDASDFVGDQATFDEAGKAATHRHFVAYSVYVRKGDHEVFSAGAGTQVDPLILVKDRCIDLRFPLKALGLDTPVRTRIEITDANIPGQFPPYEVKSR